MSENTPLDTIHDDELTDEALDTIGAGKVCYHVSAFSFWPTQH